jgi:hypothetical protein
MGASLVIFKDHGLHEDCIHPSSKFYGHNAYCESLVTTDGMPAEGSSKTDKSKIKNQDHLTLLEYNAFNQFHSFATNAGLLLHKSVCG